MRLGQADADDLLAAADPRHPVPGEPGRGAGGQDLADQRPDDLQVGDVDVAAADLLGDDAAGQPVQAAPAQLDRDLRRDQPEPADLLAQPRLDPPGPLPVPVGGKELLLGDGPGAVAVLPLAVGEFEVHDISAGQCETTCAAKSAVRFSANAAAPSRPSGEEVKRSSADIARLLRPAWWSVSALNDCLRNRIAVGLFSPISAAQALASPSSSAAGTTLLDWKSVVYGKSVD